MNKFDKSIVIFRIDGLGACESKNREQFDLTLTFWLCGDH